MVSIVLVLYSVATVGGGVGSAGGGSPEPIPATVATALVGTEMSFKAERERRVSSSKEAEHLWIARSSASMLRRA